MFGYRIRSRGLLGTFGDGVAHAAMCRKAIRNHDLFFVRGLDPTPIV
jgi:hypothetical protein